MSKKEKNKLGYSPITDRVYWAGDNGRNIDVMQNFIQVMLLWFHEKSPELQPGQKFWMTITATVIMALK